MFQEPTLASYRAKKQRRLRENQTAPSCCSDLLATATVSSTPAIEEQILDPELHQSLSTEIQWQDEHDLLQRVEQIRTLLHAKVLLLTDKRLLQVHGVLVLWLSQVLTNHLQSENVEDEGLSETLCKTITHICNTINELYQWRLLSKTSSPLLAALECQEVFDTCLRVLQCCKLYRASNNFQKVSDTQEDCRDDEEEMPRDNLTSEKSDVVAMTEAIIFCLTVMVQLSSHTSVDMSMETILTVLELCSQTGSERIRNLSTQLFQQVQSHDNNRLVSIALAALQHSGMAFDELVSSQQHTLDKIWVFSLQCALLVGNQGAVYGKCESVVERLESIAIMMSPAQEADSSNDELIGRHAVDCISILAIQQQTFVSMKRVMLEQPCSAIKRRLLPGLGWCRRQGSIGWLVNGETVKVQQQLISTLVEIILCPPPTTCSALAVRKTQQEEIQAVKILISLMTNILEPHNDMDTMDSSLRVEERDLISICAVLAEHDNESVVYMVTDFITDRLKVGASDLYASVPAPLATLGNVVERFIRCGRYLQQVDRVISAWKVLIASKNGLTQATMTRQPAVLTALIQVASADALADETRQAAVFILVRLADDVCNRRVLSCHAGLLPSLIRSAREYSQDSSSGTNQLVEREAIKKTIMQLAVAL